MCDPGSITAVVVGVLGTAASLGASKSQADANNRYQEQMALARNKQLIEANKRLEESTLQQYATKNLQLAQQEDSMSRKQYDDFLQAEQQQSTAAVSAGESGASGLSIDSLFADYMRQEEMYKSANMIQSQLLRQQLGLEQKGIEAQAKANSGQLTPYVPQFSNGPSALAGIAQFGADIGEGVVSHLKYKQTMQTKVNNPKPG